MNNQESIIIDEFVKNLEAGTEQVKQLLININDSKVELATIKTELKFAINSVRELLQLYTKVALVEEIATEAKDYINNSISRDITTSSKIAQLEEKLNNIEYKLGRIGDDVKSSNADKTAMVVRKTTGKWQIYTALIAGGFSTLGWLVNLIKSFLEN